LVFSEPVDEEIAKDYFNWSIEVIGGQPTLNVVDGEIQNRTNVFLTTLEAHEANLTYTATVQSPIPDLYGNELAAGTVVPIASFEAVLIPDDGTQEWRFNDLGIDLGPGWMTRAYVDTTWRTGQSPFDAYRPFAGGSTCRTKFPVNDAPIRTCLTLSNAANTVQIPAAYFRTHFQFAGDPDNGVLRLQGIFDDGAVVYLNGVELGRIGMPSGLVTYGTLAARSKDDTLDETYDMAASGLVTGDNVLAVELHQETLDSPDLTLALRATGIFPNRPLFSPQLSHRVVNGSIELTWPSGTLQSAEDITGPWSEVTPSNPPYQHLILPSSPRTFFRVMVSP
jgi:hypothetical protein